MAGKKGGLGMTGLDKMFGGRRTKAPAPKPVVEEKKAGETVGEVALKNLKPNPYQPRKTFDPDKLRELEESIRQSGVIQPLIVRKKAGSMKSWPENGAGGRPKPPGSPKCRWWSGNTMTVP